MVVAGGHAASGEGEDLEWRGGHQPRWPFPPVAGFHDLTCRPDQDVGVPDGGHAVIGRGLDPNGDLARMEVDGRHAPGFGQAEEGIGHQVLSVAGTKLTGDGAEQLQLLALAVGVA